MGFHLAVEGQDKLSYNKDIISTVQADLSSPSDARAKTTVTNMTLVITGKLHADSDGTNSETVKLFQWAQVPAAQDTVYRKVTVQVDTVPQRTIVLDKAFVVDYNEAYSTQVGVGTFTLVVRQKSDTVDAVKVAGGAAAVPGATTTSQNLPEYFAPQMTTGGGSSLLGDIAQNLGMAELNKLDPSGLAANALANYENIAQQAGGITAGGVLNTVGRAAVMAAVAKTVQSGMGASTQTGQELQSTGTLSSWGQNSGTGTAEKSVLVEPAAGAPVPSVHDGIYQPGLHADAGQNPGAGTLHAAGAPVPSAHEGTYQPGLHADAGQNPGAGTLHAAGAPVPSAHQGTYQPGLHTDAEQNPGAGTLHAAGAPVPSAHEGIYQPELHADAGQNPGTGTVEKHALFEPAAGASDPSAHEGTYQPGLHTDAEQNPGTGTVEKHALFEPAAGAPVPSAHEGTYQPGLHADAGQNPGTGTIEQAIPVDHIVTAPVQDTVPQGGALKSVGRAAVMAAMNQVAPSGSAATLANAVEPATTQTAVINNPEETVVKTELNKVEPTGIAAQIINNSLHKQ